MQFIRKNHSSHYSLIIILLRLVMYSFLEKKQTTNCEQIQLSLKLFNEKANSFHTKF